MDIFGVLQMVGGLALFLFGMHAMGEGLSKTSGGRLEKILEKLTSNPLKAVLLGAGVTAIIQSSSATTVMVVGFVNSGIMKLSQAVGIIMGANIGTTATSWILSLSGIEGESFLVQMLKPSSFSPILAILGVAYIMFSKREKIRDIGMILVRPRPLPPAVRRPNARRLPRPPPKPPRRAPPERPLPPPVARRSPRCPRQGTPFGLSNPTALVGFPASPWRSVRPKGRIRSLCMTGKRPPPPLA